MVGANFLMSDGQRSLKILLRQAEAAFLLTGQPQAYQDIYPVEVIFIVVGIQCGVCPLEVAVSQAGLLEFEMAFPGSKQFEYQPVGIVPVIRIPVGQALLEVPGGLLKIFFGQVTISNTPQKVGFHFISRFSHFSLKGRGFFQGDQSLGEVAHLNLNLGDVN